MSSRIASCPFSLDRHICSHGWRCKVGEDEGEHTVIVALTLILILVSIWTYVAVKAEWTWCDSRWHSRILATRRLALSWPIFLLWPCFLLEINLKQLNRYCGPITNKYQNFEAWCSTDFRRWKIFFVEWRHIL